MIRIEDLVSLLNIYRLHVVTGVFAGAGDEADGGGTGEGEGLLLR